MSSTNPAFRQAGSPPGQGGVQNYIKKGSEEKE